MKKRLLSLAAVGVMLLGIASLAMAGIPDENNSSATSNSGTMMNTPGGNGSTFAGQNCVITVTVMDGATPAAPIAGYPFQDIWVDDAGDGSISLCQGGSAADANTDGLGVTTISGLMNAGGYTQAGVRVYLAGVAIIGTPALLINMNSPDNNADLIVNIADIGNFSIDLASVPATSWRSDLVPDGTINIADIGEFSFWINDECP